MSLTDLIIPSWVKYAAIAALLGGIYATGHHLGWKSRNDKANVEQAERDRATLAAERSARATELARVIAVEGAANAADQRTIIANAGRAAAERAAAVHADTAGRLRRFATDISTSLAACNPAFASPGQAASAPTVVLANVLELMGRHADETGQRGREAAAALDAANIAGNACVSSYEAVRAAR